MGASCAFSDIAFPTDVKILNDACEKSEEIIDILNEPLVGKQKKPRTYREKARKQFLKAAKKKKLSKNQRHKAPTLECMATEGGAPTEAVDKIL